MPEIVDKINALRKEKNAVILAHLYQQPQVQDIADFVGDSLDLSRKAKDNDADVIVFCGVWFMAETAKILSPGKVVLLPEKDAGCPMADMVAAEDIQKLRKEHPKAAVVCYVNSGADIKAASDICCTSSNAIKVVQSLKEDEIIFVHRPEPRRLCFAVCARKTFYTAPGVLPDASQDQTYRCNGRACGDAGRSAALCTRNVRQRWLKGRIL